MRSARSCWQGIGSIAIVASIASCALAQDAPGSPDRNDLRGTIQRLAERPPDPTEAVQAARGRLTSRIDELEKFLAGGGVEAANRWSTWIGLPSLKAELALSELDDAELKSIEERLFQNQPGLEAQPFVAVRHELLGLRSAKEYASAASPPELFRESIAELAECVERLSANPQAADAFRAGVLLAWLEPLSDETAKLAGMLRARFCATNGVLQLSGRMANLLLQRSVEERSYISEVVLGNFTSGLAFMQGQVSVAFVPNAESGTLEIRLQGRAVCPDNVAERRRISVHSSADTSIFANKRVSISDLGLRLEPAGANCSASVQIQDIDAGRRFMERIAWRRANRVVPEAEAAASRRAESEAATKLDEQAQELLMGLNKLFCQKIRAPLIRSDALPPQFRFWTDASHLRLALSQYNGAQLAPAPPPQLPAGFDVGGGVHESMLNNLCEPLLGGRTIEDKVWHDMLQLLLGTPPRPLWVHDREEPWSVMFARQRPVVVRFDGDRIAFSLRLARVTRGTQSLDQPVEIAATFIPRISLDGPLLERVGELEIHTDDHSAAAEKMQLRKFLARKFGAIFPPELGFYGLAPPAGGSLGKLRLLKLTEFGAARGWLTVGYELTP
jgi:hypothetical protein